MIKYIKKCFFGDALGFSVPSRALSTSWLCHHFEIPSVRPRGSSHRSQGLGIWKRFANVGMKIRRCQRLCDLKINPTEESRGDTRDIWAWGGGATCGIGANLCISITPSVFSLTWLALEALLLAENEKTLGRKKKKKAPPPLEQFVLPRLSFRS